VKPLRQTGEQQRLPLMQAVTLLKRTDH